MGLTSSVTTPALRPNPIFRPKCQDDPPEKEKPVFGEVLAYLHRHNRVALTGSMIVTFVAVVQIIR